MVDIIAAGAHAVNNSRKTWCIYTHKKFLPKFRRNLENDLRDHQKATILAKAGRFLLSLSPFVHPFSSSPLSLPPPPPSLSLSLSLSLSHTKRHLPSNFLVLEAKTVLSSLKATSIRRLCSFWLRDHSLSSMVRGQHVCCWWQISSSSPVNHNHPYTCHQCQPQPSVHLSLSTTMFSKPVNHNEQYICQPQP